MLGSRNPKKGELMKRRMRTTLDLCKRVVAIATYDAKIASNPGVRLSVGRIEMLLGTTDSAQPYLAGSKHCFTAQRRALRSELLGELFLFGTHLKSYALQISDKKMQGVVHMTKTSLLKLRDDKLLEKSSSIRALAAQHMEALKEQGITDADVERLTSAADNISRCFAEKKEHNTSFGLGRQFSVTLIQQLKEELRLLDVHMLAAKANNEAVYQEYAAIRSQMRHQKRGGLSLRMKVVESETQNPLSNASIQIFKDEKGLLFDNLKAGNAEVDLDEALAYKKVTTPNGLAYCRTMEDGSYTALVSMFGYDPEVVRIFINPNNTFVLQVELQRSGVASWR